MKKKALHIVFPVLLILNLLFGQVVLNYMHTPHSEHAPDVKVQTEKPNVHRHGEHCKVCSLDIVIQLLAENPYQGIDLKPASVQIASVISSTVVLRFSSVQDRAPPRLS